MSEATDGVARHLRYDAAPGDCEVCPVARATHLETGALVECVCGRTFPAPERVALVPAAPTVDEIAPRRTSRPSVVPDRRISVVHEPRLSSSPLPGSKARSVLPDADTAEGKPGELPVTTELVAALLDEVQVDLPAAGSRGASLGAGADGPLAPGGTDWGAERVQTSPRWHRVDLAAEPAPDVDVRDTIALRTGGSGEAYDVLMWLRLYARTTGDQLRAGGPDALEQMLGVLGYHLAPAEIRERFDASSEPLRYGAPIRGRWHVRVAARAWWRLPDEGAEGRPGPVP